MAVTSTGHAWTSAGPWGGVIHDLANTGSIAAIQTNQERVDDDELRRVLDGVLALKQETPAFIQQEEEFLLDR